MASAPDQMMSVLHLEDIFSTRKSPVPQLVASWNLLWNQFKPYSRCVSVSMQNKVDLFHKFSLSTCFERKKAANVRTSEHLGINCCLHRWNFRLFPIHLRLTEWRFECIFSLNGCHSINGKPKSHIQFWNRLNWNIKFTHFNSLNHFESIYVYVVNCLFWRSRGPSDFAENNINVPWICGLANLFPP